MSNEYNSIITTQAADFPYPGAVSPMNGLLAPNVYTFDIPLHMSRNYFQLNVSSGAKPSTLGPSNSFQREDRPFVKNIRLWCNFADGFVFTTPSINFLITANNIVPSNGGYLGVPPSQIDGNALNIQLPALNTWIPIKRFIPKQLFNAVPVGVNNFGQGVSSTCLFIYTQAFVANFLTNVIDTSFNGEIPQFRLEFEVEHTFDLLPPGACV